MSEAHHRKLERMYLEANIQKEMYESTQIQISSKQATITLDLEEKYFHALGAIHGSVYFKMLDDAAFFAVNSVVTDRFVLTTNFNINLVRPASKGRLTATGELQFQSRNLFIAHASLKDEQGKEIGFGTGHFMKSQIELTEGIGYR